MIANRNAAGRDQQVRAAGVAGEPGEPIDVLISDYRQILGHIFVNRKCHFGPDS